MKSKVSLEHCNEYDYDRVYKALNKSIENLGGLDKYLNKGEKVLLKLNLLMKKKPEEAVTTHPVFVQALTTIIMEYGCEVLLGDSPGGPFSEKALTSLYAVTGIDEISKKTGAKLNFNVKSFVKSNPNGLTLKKITLTDMLNDVDKVISVSKLKTHGMMTFTGAVKNMFGVVPGLLKAEYHFNMPKYEDFGAALVDICTCANPVLSFMDGIVGMEGNGPSAGVPRNINVILASDNPYNLDKVACSIIKLDFSKVPTIKYSIDTGLCKEDLSDVELIGADINKFIINDFKIPKVMGVNPMIEKLPPFLNKFINNLFQTKPVFDHATCIGCKICADNCPAKIITMGENNRPSAQLDKCIRCYCCQELCPKKAVSIHKPFILNAFSKK